MGEIGVEKAGATVVARIVAVVPGHMPRDVPIPAWPPPLELQKAFRHLIFALAAVVKAEVMLTLLLVPSVPVALLVLVERALME